MLGGTPRSHPLGGYGVISNRHYGYVASLVSLLVNSVATGEWDFPLFPPHYIVRLGLLVLSSAYSRSGGQVYRSVRRRFAPLAVARFLVATPLTVQLQACR